MASFKEEHLESKVRSYFTGQVSVVMEIYSGRNKYRQKDMLIYFGKILE